jgi:hypothetical protein
LPVADLDDIWVPLVDEPIGSIVEEILRENPDISKLVESPHRILAFRTFAYIRVGLLLGQLLFDNDLPPYDGSGTWVEALLKNPAHHEALAREVKTVAEEIAADPKYADDEPLGPDDAARERFRAFAKQKLAES